MLYTLKASYAQGLLLHNATNATDRLNTKADNDAQLRRVMFSAISVSEARMLFMGFEDGWNSLPSCATRGTSPCACAHRDYAWIFPKPEEQGLQATHEQGKLDKSEACHPQSA